MRRLIFALSLIVPVAAAQSQYRDIETTIANEIAANAMLNVQAGVANPFTSAIHRSAIIGHLATLGMGQMLQKDEVNTKTYQSILALMEQRVDKQVGATPDTKGTTSLAMKGAVPKILGVAVQHGAITQAVNGDTVTFRATPSGLIKALKGEELKSIFGIQSDSQGDLQKPSCDWCGKLSGAITFDVSRGPDPGTLQASKQQVASWSVRAELVNQRDLRQRHYLAYFQKMAGETEYMNERAKLRRAFEDSPAILRWHEVLSLRVQEEVEEPLTAKQITSGEASQKFFEIVKSALAAERKLQLPTVDGELKPYADAITPLLENRNKLRDLASRGLLVTTDWTVTRDPNVPDLSTATLIVETSPGPGRKHDFTFNVAGSFYNSAPKVPVHRFHDFKSTAQYDIPLGSVRSYGPFVFSLAGRYERIPNDTISPGSSSTASIAGSSAAAGTAAASLKGNLVVGQAKLTVPVKGSGVRIPLSITAANRTELIKEKEVRANIGITLDLDALFARAGASNGH
jgi:hypothetical protein